jgi:hypothetical protein
MIRGDMDGLGMILILTNITFRLGWFISKSSNIGLIKLEQLKLLTAVH